MNLKRRSARTSVWAHVFRWFAFRKISQFVFCISYKKRISITIVQKMHDACCQRGILGKYYSIAIYYNKHAVLPHTV